MGTALTRRRNARGPEPGRPALGDPDGGRPSAEDSPDRGPGSRTKGWQAARRRHAGSGLDRLVTVRLGRIGWSGRLHARAIVVTVVLVVGALAVFCWSLTVGEYSIPLTDVVATLLGGGSGGNDFVIRTLRLPRGLTALLVGAAMGLSGGILQRLAQNPLASPDIIGINAGAGAAAVLAIAWWGSSGAQITFAAVAGAVFTALAVYLLAYRQGVTGYRLVLVGIGLTAILRAITQYFITKIEVYDAQRAMVWLTGSLNNRTWDDVRPLVIGLAVLIPLVIASARHLRMLELGDEAARALGARVEQARGGLLLVAVGLAAVGTASAGPIGFVALAAPQIARRLVGGRSLALLPAGACGALLLVAADLAARRIVAPTELPVGVMTGILGAPYLLYLLARANKIGRTG